MKENKFGAILTEDFTEFVSLSEKTGIPIDEIIQIDLNRCGVSLKEKEVRENFRVRFKGQIGDDHESWFALPVMNENKTPFSIDENGHIYFQDIMIGSCSSDRVLDTCESSYQRGPTLLNLNSRSRSNCAGCRACIHNYHSFYDETVLKDKKQLKTKDDIEEFFKEKNIDVSSLKQIAIVTGLFGSEENVIEHMKLVHDIAVSKGFTGELMYFGCEVNSDKALDELSKLGNVQLIYAIDNFTNREIILSKKKGLITLEDAKDTLTRAKERGIKTTISYINGIDSLSRLEYGFNFLKDSFTNFPIINVFQIQTEGQAEILNPEGKSLEYYLTSRKIIERIFEGTPLRPKRWTNYRPLWYKYFSSEELPKNSYGELE